MERKKKVFFIINLLLILGLQPLYLLKANMPYINPYINKDGSNLTSPFLFFESPIPANNTFSPFNTAEIKVSIKEQNLSTFKFNWKGKDFNFYNDSLILGMNLDNNSLLGENSTFAYDFSKYKNHGKLSGGTTLPKWTSGKYQNALSFDAEYDYVNCGSDESFKSEKGTIAFWFKANTLGDSQDIINIFENGYNDFFLIRRSSKNKIHVLIEDDNYPKVSLYSTKEIKDTNFHHIIISQDGLGIRIFIDGKESEITGTNSEYWTNHLISAEFWIGKGHWSDFNGTLDEVMIYSETINTVEKENFEGYGAQVNPTGNPIGGGVNYSAVAEQFDANYLVRNRVELIFSLANVNSGEKIYIDDNVAINLTNEKGLIIPENVTLASGRGFNGSDGALIFISTNQSIEESVSPLFFASENVRFTGIRLKGPSNGTSQTDLSEGIRVISKNVEIDNCELYGWGLAAVSFHNSTNGYIHHNYIHHNQRAGYGYGVVLNKADALIEANLFNYCRHNIAATGRPGTSYEARYNIILENATSHSFDMHGAPDFEKFYRISHWRFDDECGPIAEDSSLYGAYNDQPPNNGKLMNMDQYTCWVEGKINTGLKFDGVNDFLDCSNNTGLNISKEITLEGWIYTTSTPEKSNQIIITKGDNLTLACYFLYLNGEDDKIYFSIGKNINVSWNMPTGLKNAWHHIAGTYNGSELKLYYDGSLKAVNEYIGSIATNSKNLTIGAFSDDTFPFNGTLDEVLIYSLALSEEDINRHYLGYTDIAGDRIKIHHNTFQATNIGAIKIRGKPFIGAWVYRNWFFHTESNLALMQVTSLGNLYVYDNCYNSSFNRYNLLFNCRLKKHNSTQWYFSFNTSHLQDGIYTYYAWANNSIGNGGYIYGRDDQYLYNSNNPRYLKIYNSVDLEVILLNDSSVESDDNREITLICDVFNSINLQNITLHIWKNKSIYYTNTKNISGIMNSVIWTISLTKNESFTWNCLAYDITGSSAWSSANFSLIFDPVDEYDEDRNKFNSILVSIYLFLGIFLGIIILIKIIDCKKYGSRK